MPNYFVFKNLVDTIYSKEKPKRPRTVLKKQPQLDEDDVPLSKIVNSVQNNAKICRICLKEGSLQIFDGSERMDKAAQIKNITNVEIVKSDKFPKYMCEPCDKLLESAITFREICQESDRTLQQNEKYMSLNTDTHILQASSVKEEIKQEECILGAEDQVEELPLEPFVDPINELEAPKPVQKQEDEKKYRVKLAITPIAKSVLKIEVKTKEIPKTFRCEKCELDFSSSIDFSRHRRTLKHKNTMEKCNICDMEMTASYIKTHIRRVHSIERPYICDVCGKGFAQEAAFRRHAAIHTDDLPYKCEQCPYRGRFRESVRIHMRTHTGERPFSCSECSMSFATKSNLNRHSRQHKNAYPHECNECQRGFYTIPELQRHFKVVHSGVKDFPCNICGKEFGWRKEMKKHQRRVHHVAKCDRKGREPLYLRLEKKMQMQDYYNPKEPSNG